MKRAALVMLFALAWATAILPACSSGGACAPEDQSILLISTSPPDARAQANGVDTVRLTISGKDEFCQPLKDTQVQLNLTNPSPAGVGEFVENGTGSLSVTLGKFGAQAQVRSRQVGTVRVEAFCQEHNLTALPVTLTFREPDVTGRCAVELGAVPPAIEADGVSTSAITATLHADNDGPMPNGTQVRFTTTKGRFTESNTTEYTTTSQNSQAQATLRSETVAEETDVTVTATFTCDDNKTYSGNETVRFGQLDRPRVDLRSSTSSVFADDVDAASLTAEVFRAGGEKVGAGVQVDFLISEGPGYFRENTDTLYTAQTDADGIAHVTFVGGMVQGTAKITANVFVDNVNAYDDVTINVRALGSIRFVSAVPTKLGVKGSGKDESSDVTFQLLDTLDQPFPAGALVDFTTSIAPGVTLDPASARTESDGKVKTTLNAGTQATTVTVTATARVGAVTLQATSPSIAIVGAKPNASFLTFSCELFNVGGFILDFVETKCTVSLADRFSNKIGFATNVVFRAEAGSITAEALTSETGATMGMATVTTRTGNPRPKDIQPIGGEPVIYGTRTPPTGNQICYNDNDCREDQTHAAEVCLNPGVMGSLCQRSYNPRDGLLTLIVATTGEEAFNDINGNGQYDDGEPFVDLTEPFVDANDNGQYDVGETFIDADDDGFFSDRDGVWDTNTLIWTDARILWTGEVTMTSPSADCTTSPLNRYSIMCSTRSPRDSFTIAKDEFLDFIWEAKDFNLNPVNETLGISVTITGKGQLHSSSPALPFNAPDTLGNNSAYWSVGGGFNGSFTVKGNNSGATAEPGIITLTANHKRTVGDSVTITKTVTLNGTFTP